MTPNENGKDDPVLLAGIDLGTARSAVVTNRGERAWTESLVGWPRDFVARRAIGKAIVFGEEARLSRAAAIVVQPLEQGTIQQHTPRAEEAAGLLVQHLFDLVGAREDQNIHAVIGVPAEALRHNREVVLQAAQARAARVRIVPEPFAVAYGLGALTDALVIDIGAGTIDLCATRGALPEPQDLRSHPEAGAAVDRRLFDAMEESYPEVAVSLSFARQCKEQHGFAGAPERQVLIDLPTRERRKREDLTDALRRACEALVPPVVEMATDLISRQEPERQRRIRQHTEFTRSDPTFGTPSRTWRNTSSAR